MTIVEHDAKAQRFLTELEGYRAVLDYQLLDGVMTITHTGVPQPIGGRGVAASLMQAALGAARGAGWTVDPACSYAAAYLRRHALDESFPTSDSPSVGGSR